MDKSPSKQLVSGELDRKRRRLTIWQWSIGALAAIALLGSLVLAFFGWGQRVETGGIKIAQVLVVVLWTLAPPIWFWAEYIFLFRSAYPEPNENQLNALKTQQDLSSKIWIAATSVLLILYFWKDIGGGR